MDKGLISEFQAVTSTTKVNARKYLKAAKNNLELAIDNYFQETQPQLARASQSIFNLYSTTDTMDADGTERLLADLQVDPSSLTTTAIFYLLKSPSLYEFTRKEFDAGLEAQGIKTIEDFKSRIRIIDADLRDNRFKKKVYTNIFMISKGDNQKALDLDTALLFWDMFCADFVYLSQWKDFLLSEYKRPISKDTWNLFWEFTLCFKGVESHDTEGMTKLIRCVASFD